MKILALLLVAIGGLLVYGAKTIVEKFQLDNKVQVTFESELTQEEIQNYKKQRAILSIKIIGSFVALPGLVLVLILFK